MSISTSTTHMVIFVISSSISTLTSVSKCPLGISSVIWSIVSLVIVTPITQELDLDLDSSLP